MSEAGDISPSSETDFRKNGDEISGKEYCRIYISFNFFINFLIFLLN